MTGKIKSLTTFLYISFIPLLIVTVSAHWDWTIKAGFDPLLQNVNAEELQHIIDAERGEKAVLVNVWATWCGPCIEEFPEIVKLQQNYPDQLKVIFISADFKDSRQQALDFLEEQEVDWTTYFKTGPDEEFITTLSEEWTGALPFTKVIDVEGNLVNSWEQSADYEKFERYVKMAIDP